MSFQLGVSFFFFVFFLFVSFFYSILNKQKCPFFNQKMSVLYLYVSGYFVLKRNSHMSNFIDPFQALFCGSNVA